MKHSKKYGDDLGPKYEPKSPVVLHICPKCGKKAAFYKEIHPDTSMNDIVLKCKACGFLDE